LGSADIYKGGLSMAAKINESLEKIKACLDSKTSFILEAGAGSGKTWTLIESLKHILESQGKLLEKGNKQVACITYTNVAKDEIIERIDNNKLVLVLTIHEFLWYVIKNYQNELKIQILNYNREDKRKQVEDLETKIQKVSIEYSQYGRKFERGRITHEDVLEFSSLMFTQYPKLSKIVANQFPFVFIDEYQDTEKRTVDLLIEYLLANNLDQITLGFFGDYMQKIYNQGIGKIESDKLITVTKKENFRCSKKVIELLSKIRPELVQVPAGKNLDGEITFIHCKTNDKENFHKTTDYLKVKKGWEIESKTKILFLTHKGIANKLGYENLFSAYDKIVFGRERLLNREELFSNFILLKVEHLVNLYHQKNYREFITQLGIEGFKIQKHEDKKRIRDLIDELIDLRLRGSVNDVLNFVFAKDLLVKPLKMDEFLISINKAELEEGEKLNKDFYNALMPIKYQEFISVNEYIEDYTPYSTKHGVKGAEFDNVLVVFNDVFSNNVKNKERYSRTLNLLYVCCSRAKDKLVLLSLSGMDASAMATVNAWFGNENVFDLANL
jgi:DNA helicase-2/ATP-dependent DNA helicase PcrA